MALFFSSDSTTLPIGKLAWSTSSRDDDAQADLTLYKPDDDAHDVEEAGPRAKIHQSDACIALLITRSDGSHTLLILPFVSPLQVTDSGKAETARVAWSESLRIEFFEEVSELAASSYDFFSMDRDSANVKGHRGWEGSAPTRTHHRGPCYSHCFFTIAGSVWHCCDGLVSGVISVNLGTRSGSHWKILKTSLKDTILSLLDPVDGDPPELTGLLRDRLEEYFNVFCFQVAVVT